MENNMNENTTSKICQCRSKIIFGIIILICGMVIGAGGVIIFGQKYILHFIPKDPQPKNIVERINKRLDLSDKQRIEVEKIVAKWFPTVENNIQQTRDYMYQIEDEIAEVLDENQKIKWRKRTEQLRRPFPNAHKRSISYKEIDSATKPETK
jgi:hypothetical protein